MPRTQWDQKVQTLSTHGAHKALAFGVCFWRPHGCSQDSDAHVRHGLVQFLRKDAVPIADHEALRMAARQGFTKLLECPRGVRLLVNGQTPRHTQSAGSASISVPSIADHEVVGIDL